MCLPPGATSASPERTRSRWRASRTSIWQRLSSRWAKAAVNFSGMCWTMTMPGESTRSCLSTSSSAWVPPVDVPSATTRSVVVRALAAGSAGRAGDAGDAAGVLRATVTRGRVAAACWICLMRSLESCNRLSFRPSRALVNTPTAPAAKASRVMAAPASVNVEQMIVGVGRSAINLRRKVMPSMRGISTSSTNTSGQLRCIFSSANSGSAACPITSIFGWFSRQADST